MKTNQRFAGDKIRRLDGGKKTKPPQQWRDRIVWVRFEIECFNQCQKFKTDIWPTISSLLFAGKRDGTTRPNIETALRYQRSLEASALNQTHIPELQTIFKRVRSNAR